MEIYFEHAVKKSILSIERVKSFATLCVSFGSEGEAQEQAKVIRDTRPHTHTSIHGQKK